MFPFSNNDVDDATHNDDVEHVIQFINNEVKWVPVELQLSEVSIQKFWNPD